MFSTTNKVTAIFIFVIFWVLATLHLNEKELEEQMQNIVVLIEKGELKAGDTFSAISSKKVTYERDTDVLNLYIDSSSTCSKMRRKHSLNCNTHLLSVNSTLSNHDIATAKQEDKQQKQWKQ